MLREGMLEAGFPSIALDVLFVVALSLLIYGYFNKTRSYGFELVFLAVAVYYLLKIILLNLLHWVFFSGRLKDVHLPEVLLFNKVIGIALLPLLIVGFFVEIPTHQFIFLAGLWLVTGLFIYRFIRVLIQFHKSYPYGFFFCFIYLCTIEISPLLVIYIYFINA